MKNYLIVVETASGQTQEFKQFGRNSHDAVRILIQQSSSMYDIEFIVSVTEVK